ncbi:MAG: GNAT family N-acetyltransferase [Myxococcales bacterium]|nr:GNAT family N-acetyltransferase [Myxococcales bacterium]
MSADLEFRPVTADDYPALAALSVLAYPWGGDEAATRVERYRARFALWDAEAMIVQRAGHHVGMYTTLRYNGWLGGVTTRVAGLAGVAVAPEARRSGVAGAMVRDHLRRAHAAGSAWSMLYPFAADFYARYGWATVSRRVRWRIRPSELPPAPGPLPVERLSLARPEHLAAVQRVYEAFCARTSGSLSRTAGQLVWQWSGDRRMVIGTRDEAGELTGYLLATLRSPSPRPQVLVVPELSALDDRAHRALLGFLGAQVDQADFIELDTPVDDPLGALLTLRAPERETLEMPEEHQPLGAVYSGIMARVVDLSRALVERGYPPGATARIAFAPRDPLLPHNELPITLTIEEGRPRVAPGRSAGAPLLSGPVGELSRILVGGVALSAALRFGQVSLEGGDPDPISRLLALPAPYPLVVF